VNLTTLAPVVANGGGSILSARARRHHSGVFIANAAGFNKSAGSGTGANGTTFMAIRADIIGGVRPGDTAPLLSRGTPVSGGLRPLTNAEMAVDLFMADHQLPALQRSLGTALTATTDVGSLVLGDGAASVSPPRVILTPPSYITTAV